MGRPGRKVVTDKLPDIQLNLSRYIVDARDFKPAPLRFTIVNGENAAGGVGITPDNAQDIFEAGADAITLGNHWHNKRDILSYLPGEDRIVRPGNVSPKTPGRGMTYVEREGTRLAVINLCGRVFMDPYDDPFRVSNELLGEANTDHVFFDFHGEATSEKIAFGYHVDGRATAVVGTHTHVTTADECVLPGGTAYITDVGMCGPKNSVLGVRKEIILERFRTGLPAKFEVAEEPGVISGVVINVKENTGRATGIRRISAR